jgi:2,4-dienoyl-CoA reductase-like NADH-dependent reductase (Old Yellow Enzyme family)
MHDVEMAECILREGHADMVSIGRWALANPDWPVRLRRGYAFEPFDPHMIHPSATLEHADWWLFQRDASGNVGQEFSASNR